MRRAILPLLLMAAAAPALAQPAAAPVPGSAAPAAAPTAAQRDLIAALLAGHAPGDEDEPDTAGQPRTPAEAEPSVLPSAPVRTYTPAPRPQLDAPVQIDDVSRTPDSPPSVRDLAYDARIRASFASAESFQGPLDGGWTLSGDGQEIYVLQLVDRRDRLEGVWRDTRRTGSMNASGLVDDMQRQGGQLILRFAPTVGATPTLITLRDSGGGQWSGELSEAGAVRRVSLRRTGP